MASIVKLNIDGVDYICTPQQPPLPATTILGWKADDIQFDLVKSFGGLWVSCSRWPGGGLTQNTKGLKVIPRYQSERSATSGTALSPLFTMLARTTAVDIAERDADAYVLANVLDVAVGNEPDSVVKGTGLRRFWTGTMGEFGPTYGIYIAPVFRRRGMSIIWELPQRDVINVYPFVKGLVDSGAYQVGDTFSFHPYQSTANAHIDRFKQAFNEVKRAIPNITWADMESLEWSIARGGPDSERLIELQKLKDLTWALGIKRVFHYRICRNQHPESYNSPYDENGQPTFSHSFWKQYA